MNFRRGSTELRAEPKLRSSEKHVRSLPDKLSKRRNEWSEKNASSGEYWERFVVLKHKMESLTPDFNRLTAQHTAHKTVLYDVRTDLLFHKQPHSRFPQLISRILTRYWLTR